MAFEKHAVAGALGVALLRCGKVVPDSNDAGQVFCDGATPSAAPELSELARCYMTASWPQCHWTLDGGVALDGGSPACPDGYRCVAVSMTFDWDAGPTDDVACDVWDGAAVPGYHSLCWPSP